MSALTELLKKERDQFAALYEIAEKERFAAETKNAAQATEIERLKDALKHADKFISNGIEYGHIRMPDAELNDSASETPGIVKAALSGWTKEHEYHAPESHKPQPVAQHIGVPALSPYAAAQVARVSKQKADEREGK